MQNASLAGDPHELAGNPIQAYQLVKRWVQLQEYQDDFLENAKQGIIENKGMNS